MSLRQPLFTVPPRSRSAAALLLAALVMAAAATTLVATVPLYEDAISEAGFRRTLADAAPEDRGIVATYRDAPAAWPGTVETISAVASARLPARVDTFAFAETGSYGFPPEIADTDVITTIGTYASAEPMFDVVDGDPAARPADGAIGASLTSDAAEQIGMAVGDRMELDGRADAAVTVELVAIIEPGDRIDPLWFGVPKLRDGVIVNGSFLEIGPFLVGADDFAGLDKAARFTWRGLLDPSSASTDELPALRSGASGMTRAVGDRLDRDDVDIDTGLPSLLASTDTALGSTGAVIAVILVQLVGLALYGLGMAAAVLAGARLVETALLRSRGATAAQMAAIAAAEALFVVVPAAVLGPVLARTVVDLIERWGPVAASGLDLAAEPSRVALAGSAVVGVVAIGVMTWPAFRSAKALAAASAERTRPTGPNVLQRTGADLVIAALAIAGLWQLSRTSAASRDLSGRLGTDPVLVLAPTLGVIAVSLITLRLIAVLARFTARAAPSGSGLSGALAGWELARRPGRTARTSVLVVLSVTIGTFAAVQGASWEQSQRDQADAAVSADVLVTPDARPAATIAPLFHPMALAGLEGVEAVAPVDRPITVITTELGNITTVATDVRRIEPLLRLRDDLREPEVELEDLHRAGDVDPLPIETSGDEVSADLTARLTIQRAGSDTGGNLAIAVLVVDRFGTIHRIEADPVPVDATEATLRFPLTSEALPGVDLRAAAPLGLLRWEIAAPILSVEDPTGDVRRAARFELELSELMIDGAPADLTAPRWFVAPVPVNANTLTRPAIWLTNEGDALAIKLDTGRTQQLRASATMLIGTSPFQSPRDASRVVVRAFVTPALLDSLALEIGDSARARIGGTAMSVRLAGVIPVVPFATDDPVAMLVDWPSLTGARYRIDARHEPPEQWALAVGEDQAAVVTATLAAPPFDSPEIAGRRALARELADDPFAIGLLGSLVVALVASMLVALVGLLLTAVVGARERRASYSMLRAMGAPTRVLRRWLLIEIVPLVALSTVAGVVAGVLLARTTLDSLTVTSEGERAIPPAGLVLPWPTLGAIVAVALAAGIAMPLLTGRLLGRHNTADDLRIGDAA